MCIRDRIKDRVLSFNESQAEPYEELKNGDEIEQEIKLYTRDISKITLYTCLLYTSRCV